jgi:hydrogenase expression/formation protein HypC
MCVGVPAKVIEKMEYSAVVDVMGSQTTTGTIFVPEVSLGIMSLFMRVKR